MAKHITTVVCTGSRTWEDEAIIYSTLIMLPEPCHVIVGDAKGADAMVRMACQKIGLSFDVFKADWEAEGKSAGPRRNTRMLQASPDRVLVFMRGTTAGTLDCMRKAMHEKVPVEMHWRPAELVS